MSTILIVDDDPHLRELSRIFLQQEGFDIADCALTQSAVGLCFFGNHQFILCLQIRCIVQNEVFGESSVKKRKGEF